MNRFKESAAAIFRGDEMEWNGTSTVRAEETFCGRI